MRVKTKQIRVSTLRPHPQFSMGRGALRTNVRHPGHHISGVLKYIATTTGIVDWKMEGGEFELNEMMFLGQAFEAYIVPRLPSFSGTVWQPGTIKLVSPSGKPVYGNPDGYTPDAWVHGKRRDCIEEFKLTWKSARHNVRSQWMYLQQIMAYANGYQTPRARLWIYHVNGFYEKHQVGSPVLYAHELEFTRQEMQSNLNMILSTVDEDEGNNLVEGRK